MTARYMEPFSEPEMTLEVSALIDPSTPLTSHLATNSLLINSAAGSTKESAVELLLMSVAAVIIAVVKWRCNRAKHQRKMRDKKINDVRHEVIITQLISKGHEQSTRRQYFGEVGRS
ncbi:hypothetical protein K470DRAFT_257418 [Piedraia hortae CBS 480.64]|uniref:Uncharacterized protein n=1 Tax=Piedraia hortae CBS 480.64 TaxID=1314780 RepID=A0A6A7C035_9PEZI|nr:hypothetical protein K470DRAFT_257418 [Piedraia hortae CBS 480.64]